jgi:hypothetical protein
MARVVLHIGGHKTGTTYLQNLFHHNRHTLAAAGLYYPDIGPNTAHHVLASPWLSMRDIPDNFFVQNSPEQLWDNLIARYAKGPGTVFLSGENFSRAYPQAVDMADLARRLSAFEDVRVIYTMRAQAEAIQSIWLQVAKNGRKIGIYVYVRNAIAQRRAIGVWIDYNAVYDSLLKGFSPEQIHFFDYGQIRNAPGGIAQVMLDSMEINLRAEDLTPPTVTETNISPDPLGFWIASEITKPDVPGASLIEAVTRPLRETDRPNTLLARHEHVKIAGRYGAANSKLVDRLQATQPGFTFREVIPSENMIYREEIPDTVWLQIARAAHTTQESDLPTRSFLLRAKSGLKGLR